MKQKFVAFRYVAKVSWERFALGSRSLKEGPVLLGGLDPLITDALQLDGKRPRIAGKCRLKGILHGLVVIQIHDVTIRIAVRNAELLSLALRAELFEQDFKGRRARIHGELLHAACTTNRGLHAVGQIEEGKVNDKSICS